ncbi:MAG: hypothetical protein IK070_03145 [Clostridia bacterium]|nr:hypothetical protein [Clostridia bacterium]
MAEEKEVAKESEKKEIVVTKDGLAMVFALVSLCLVVLYKVLTAFGVWSSVLFGIMAVVVYGLTIAGAILSYLQNKKCTLWVVINAALFALSVLILP